MKRKILLLLGLVLLGGCELEYNLNITDDKTFHEEVIIAINREYYDKDNRSLQRKYQNEISEYFAAHEKYEYDVITKRDEILLMFYREYDTFADYSKSPFVNQAFHSIYFWEDQYYSIKTSERIYDVNRGVAKDSKYYLQDLIINIRSQNHVAETNAQDKNLSTNIYTWHFDDAEIKGPIEIDLDYTKRYDIILVDFVSANFWWLLILTVGTIIAISSLVIFTINNKKRNQI